MTDEQMTILCAEAMEYREHRIIKAFDPLHNDAHAMALVKRFSLSVSPSAPEDETFKWSVELNDESAHADDLNHALVECVAKMQQAKATP